LKFMITASIRITALYVIRRGFELEGVRV